MLGNEAIAEKAAPGKAAPDGFKVGTYEDQSESDYLNLATNELNTDLNGCQALMKDSAALSYTPRLNIVEQSGNRDNTVYGAESMGSKCVKSTTRFL